MISSWASHERTGGRGFLETTSSDPEEPSEITEEEVEASDSETESNDVEGDNGGLKFSSETLVVLVSSEDAGESGSLGIPI